jgi:hypothetical protein
MWMLLALLLSQAPTGPNPTGQRVPAPSNWVAFSAELVTTHPSRSTTFGRQLQDEHGCLRRETVSADGTQVITINNYETARTYTFSRGIWTSQEIRLIPGLTRRPPQFRVERLVKQVEGFDAYLSTATVTSSRGNYTEERLVLPALNFLVVEHKRTATNETITAQNIRIGPPDQAEFLPPPGASVDERPGVSAGQFSAVVVWIAFANQPSIELTTTEEKPIDVRTPLGETLQIVTTVVDHEKDVVRIRIMKNTKGTGPVGEVTGDELGEVRVALGRTAETTTLTENFTVSVRRIRDRRAGK